MQFKQSHKSILVASVAVVSALLGSTTHAAINASWSGTGNWSDATKWSTNPTVPGAIDDIAQLPNTSTGDGTTTLDGARTVGTLQNITPIGAGRTWTINASAGNALTMQRTTGSALINVTSNVGATLTINPAIVTASPLTISATGNDGQIQTINLNGTLTGTGNVTTDFDGTGSNAGSNINISSLNTTGTFTAQGNKSSNGTKIATISGVIGANVTTVTKTGSSTLVFTGTNLYTGNTTVSGGVLRANDGVGLKASSLLTLSGGTLESSANFTRSLGSGVGEVQLLTTFNSGFSARGGPVVVALGGTASPTALTWGSGGFAPNDFILNAASADNTLDFRNAVNLNGSAGQRTVQVSANVATMSGVISNSLSTSYGLTKTGAGVLALTGINTYQGTTTVSGGVLRATEGVGLPTNSRIAITSGVIETNQSLDRPIGSTASTDQMRITGGTSGFSARGGPIQVAFGTLATPTALTWGASDFAPSVFVLNAATADNTLDFRNAISLGSANATRTVQVDANVATLSGVLSNSAATLNLTKTGLGTLVLGNVANSYNGTTTISAGTLRANDGTSLPSTGNLNIAGGVFETGVDMVRPGGSAAGQVQLTASNSGFSAFGGPVVVAIGGTASPTALTWGTTPFNPGSTLILNAATANNTLDFKNAINLGASGNNTRTIQTDANVATISGLISSSGGTQSLTKTGVGTLVLTNANSYNGTTSVSGGTLLVNGSLDSRTTAVNVSAGATLGGSGTINRPVNVTGNLAPGNSPGTLDIVGNTAFNTGSAFTVELNGKLPGDGATDYDQLNVTGTVNLTGTVTLAASVLPNGINTIASTDVFYILTRSAAGTLGANTFDTLAEGATVSLNGGLYSGKITYLADWTGTQAGSSLTGGNDVALYNVVVPEPTTFSLLAIGAGALLRRRRAV